MHTKKTPEMLSMQNQHISRQMKPLRITNVVIEPGPEYVTLFSRSRSLAVKISASALFIWQLCDGRSSIESIADQCSKVDKERVFTYAEISEAIKTLYVLKVISFHPGKVNDIVTLAYMIEKRPLDILDNLFTAQLNRHHDLLIVGRDESPDILITEIPADKKFNLKPGLVLVIEENEKESDYCHIYSNGLHDEKRTFTLADGYLRNSNVNISPEFSSLLKIPPENGPKHKLPLHTGKRKPKLTIGMATYDDYDGVYFTVQAIRMFHPEVIDEVDILVIDNNPEGPCSDALKDLSSSVIGYRYLAKDDIRGTAVRDFVFSEATTEYVMCVDSHVFIEPGAIRKLIDYFQQNSGTADLLQGPLVHDDMKTVSTHFEPVWIDGMYGVWAADERGQDPAAVPFDIPMQGLGLAACRRDAWQGYNHRFRGFGGEEGYIHQKFRNAGARTLCLPFLRWMHRFVRPMGTRYEIIWEDRIRNFLIGFAEVGYESGQVMEHFGELLDKETVEKVARGLATE